MEKKYPIGGYAPGNYHCTCATCHAHFQGDKRAVQCEPCALAAKERFDALDPNEQELLIKRNAMIANFMFSGPLTPERELIYRIVEQWGNAVEMPNMEGWLKEYAAKATPQGIGWVNCAERMPGNDTWSDDPMQYILKCKWDGSRGNVDIKHVTAEAMGEVVKNYDYCEWLDEGLPKPGSDK